MMTPQRVKYVLALADELSFSKAAQKLFISQPSLSQNIKNLDLCIMSGTLDDKLFHYETLDEEQLYLAVPPDHPFNEDKRAYQVTPEDIVYDSRHLYQVIPVDLADCAELTFVFQSQEQEVQPVILALTQKASFHHESTLYTERIETAFAWTLAGMACSLIPDTLIRFGNFRRHPVYYKIDPSLSRRNIIIAHKKNRYLSKAASAYILLLKQLIGSGTWLPSGAQ
jgi:DNA-binding transcriptional LysR family regulator